jgi:hypothetical protein
MTAPSTTYATTHVCHASDMRSVGLALRPSERMEGHRTAHKYIVATIVSNLFSYHYLWTLSQSGKQLNQP